MAELPRTTSSSSIRRRRLAAAVGVVVTLGLAVGLVVWEPWHGPIILSLSSGHGIATGDLLAIPLVALAVAIGRVRSPHPPPPVRSAAVGSSGRWVGPAAAVVLGVLLLVVSVIDLTDRGPLVPAGGGTFDGALKYVAGRSANPVRAWSYVALTYDGATLRLFVNGTQVSSRARTGTIRTTTHPLWIGGNHPYGEYFEGVIDEARVYDRALDQAEIRADMATPVAADSAPRPNTGDRAAIAHLRTVAVGLVGAYAFDEGSGTSVADASGNGNVGTISGATWTSRGRYGSALSFDGAGDRVRVPASDSLDVGAALTLSAWIRPAASQRGWRTIVYREHDTYFLAASSGLTGLAGPADDVLAGAVVAAAAWFTLVTVRSRGRWVGQRRRTWRMALGLLLIGCVVDAAFAPSATVFGPTLLAAWFAATATNRGEAISGGLVAAGFLGVTVASLADPAGVGAWMQRDDGGIARSAALGVALLVAGLVLLRRGPRPASG